ncbi:MAG: hypothetical protein ACJ76Y_05810 [Thermoanaerobaculia bacterium]
MKPPNPALALGRPASPSAGEAQPRSPPWTFDVRKAWDIGSIENRKEHTMRWRSTIVVAVLSWALLPSFVTHPAMAASVSGEPTLYIFQNETAREKTVSFLAEGEGELRIGFECALGKTDDDTTGGFVEVDGRRIYTGRDMRRVFASEVTFAVPPGQHSVTVGFDRPIHAAYVKIFGTVGVQELRPVRPDALERVKTMIRQLSPSEKKALFDWLKTLT